MMDSEVSSFFDSDSKLERLWSNNVSELSFNPDEVIISGELSKYSQSDKKFKLRYFVLTKDRLLCFQVNSYINLRALQIRILKATLR